MTDIGEIVAVGEFISDEKHDENTCPWHSEKQSQNTEEIIEQTPDEDTDEMPKNLGTALGKNLGDPPSGEVWIEYYEGEEYRFKKGDKTKSVQSYDEDNEYLYCYDLQYAPHHLIPGNESLKKSEVVKFLGDSNAIKNFGDESDIKDGFTTGYDVNHENNGEWLPSPYALSMSNKWPSKDGVKVIKKRKGQSGVETAEDFKKAYVAAAIEASNNKQFHMRHNKYSAEVRKATNAIGVRLFQMTLGDCPIATESEDDEKFDPPMGLVARMDVLSNNLRRLLTGPVWRDPIYTDNELMKDYIDDLNKTEDKGDIDKVV